MCPHTQIARALPSAGPKRLRCVLAHEHALVRQALRRLLETELAVDVVAETATASETLKAVWERIPDVVLGNSEVMRLPAGEAARWLRRGSSGTQILFLEGNSLPAGARESAHIVGKDFSVDDLRKALDALLAISPNLPNKMQPAAGVSTLPAKPERMAHLTGRQCDVVRLVAQGKTVRQAAKVLGVSAKTVDTHKTNLMRRLGIHNKAELVLWAVNQGLVSPPSAARDVEMIPRIAKRQAQAAARASRLETSRSGTAATAFAAPTPERADGRFTHTAGNPRD